MSRLAWMEPWSVGIGTFWLKPINTQASGQVTRERILQPLEVAPGGTGCRPWLVTCSSGESSPERDLWKRIRSFTRKSPCKSLFESGWRGHNCPHTVHTSSPARIFSSANERWLTNMHTRTPYQSPLAWQNEVLQTAVPSQRIGFNHQLAIVTTSKWTYTTIHWTTRWKSSSHFQKTSDRGTSRANSSSSIIRMTYGSIEIKWTLFDADEIPAELTLLPKALTDLDIISKSL